MYNLAFMDFNEQGTHTVSAKVNNVLYLNHSKTRIGSRKSDVILSNCSHISKYWKYIEFDRSYCFDEYILNEFRSTEFYQPLNIINIGLRKGYDIGLWMNTFASYSGLNTGIWWNISQELNISICGSCHGCKTSNSSIATENMPRKDITIIGIDLNKENIKLVDNIMKQIKQNNGEKSFQNISIHTILAVVSNKKGEVWVERCPIGYENCKIIQDKDASKTGKNAMHRIPEIRIDDLVKDLQNNHAIKSEINSKNQALSPSHNGSVSVATIDILRIATISYAHLLLVIDGAMNTLRSGSIRMIIFESQPACTFSPRATLEIIIRRLHFEANYDCYFIGQMRLWKVTGCWHPLWETKVRSNVMCLLRQDAWHTLAENKLRVTVNWVTQRMRDNNITTNDLATVHTYSAVPSSPYSTRICKD